MKFSQDTQNTFDGGQKGGENWKDFIRNYFIGRMPHGAPAELGRETWNHADL